MSVKDGTSDREREAGQEAGGDVDKEGRKEKQERKERKGVEGEGVKEEDRGDEEKEEDGGVEVYVADQALDLGGLKQVRTCIRVCVCSLPNEHVTVSVSMTVDICVFVCFYVFLPITCLIDPSPHFSFSSLLLPFLTINPPLTPLLLSSPSPHLPSLLLLFSFLFFIRLGLEISCVLCERTICL